MDVTLAFVLLVCVAPLLVLLCLAIWIDSPGHPIFRQRRVGHHGQVFRIYKLRSMFVAEDGANIVQATEDDQRVTKIGRLLRQTSLDELPQLVNVLMGQMSLVGPRPHALTHDQQFAAMIPGYSVRYRVRPGLTGWAQVNGCRGEVKGVEGIRRRVELDAWYVENFDAMLDLRILVTTIPVLISRTAAY